MNREKKITGWALFTFGLYEWAWWLWSLEFNTVIIVSLLSAFVLGWLFFPSPKRTFLSSQPVRTSDLIRFVLEGAFYISAFVLTWMYQNMYIAAAYGALCVMSVFDNKTEIRGIWRK